MKKFLSLLCALTIVLGTSAAPQRLHKPLNKDARQLEQRFNKAKTVQERDEIMLKYKRSHKASATTSAIAKAPKVRHDEPEKVAIDRVSTFVMGVDEELVISYGLHQSEENGNKHFYFSFPLAEGQHDIELGKTYSLAEMDATDCTWDQDEYDEDWDVISYQLTSATFTKTLGTGYDFHITATVTDENGKVFALSYDEEALVPTGEEKEVTFSQVMDFDRDFKGQWLLRSSSKDYFVQLAFYGPAEIAGTYDRNAIVLNESYVEFPTDEVDEYDEPVYKTVYLKDGTIVVKDADGRTDVSASVLGADGVRYNVKMFFETPKPLSKDTIEAKNLYIDDWSFEWMGELAVYGGDVDGVYIGLSLYRENTEDGFLGDYVIENEGRSRGEVTVDHETYSFYSGTVNVARENDQYVVTGTALAWNNVEYTFRLREPDVVVTPKNFTSDKMVIDIYNYNDEQWFEIAGFDSDREKYLLLTVLSDKVAGSYTETDLDQKYTYLTIGDTTYAVISADLTVEYTAPQAKVSGTILLINTTDQYDKVELTVEATAKPYEPSERNVTISAFSREYVAGETEEGEKVYALYYQLLSEDRQQLFGLMFKSTQWAAEVELGKTYTMADMFESYGQNAYEREYIVYTDVQFTKTATEDNVKIVAKIKDTRGNVWNLTYEGEEAGLATPFDVRLGQANNIAHDTNAIEYEMVDVDNTFKCVLVIPVEEGAEDVENDRTYSSQDDEINLIDSYMSILGEEHAVTSASFHKESYGDFVEINATVIDERGYTYRLSFYDDGFHPTGDTLQIVIAEIPSVVYDAEYSAWRIYAEDEAHVLSLQLADEVGETPVGEYDVWSIVTWSSHIEVITGLDDDGYPISEYIGMHTAYSVTITGEEENYAIRALFMGEDGNVYDVYVNTRPEGIEDVQTDNVQCTKLIENGQLYIIRENRKYNVLGF